MTSACNPEGINKLLEKIESTLESVKEKNSTTNTTLFIQEEKFKINDSNIKELFREVDVIQNKFNALEKEHGSEIDDVHDELLKEINMVHDKLLKEINIVNEKLMNKINDTNNALSSDIDMVFTKLSTEISNIKSEIIKSMDTHNTKVDNLVKTAIELDERCEEKMGTLESRIKTIESWKWIIFGALGLISWLIDHTGLLNSIINQK